MDTRVEQPDSVAAVRSRRQFARITALAGFTLTILTFYPGFVVNDSWDQFQQGLTFSFSDWHPPIMAFVWSLLDAIWPGPEPMLFLQAGLYWGGVYYLTSAIPTRSIATRWIVAALLFSPVILVFAGVVWKDSQLAAAWSFVAGCAFAQRAKGVPMRWPMKAMLMAILGYGALLRHNSGMVAGPLVLYVLTGRPVARRLWLTVAIYAAVAIGALASGQILNRLLRAQHTAVSDSLVVFDLAGISAKSGTDAFPFPLTSTEMSEVKQCYGRGETWDPFRWGNCSFIWPDTQSSNAKKSLLPAWEASIAHNIPAYLQHRLGYFGVFLGISRYDPWVNGVQTDNGAGWGGYGYKTRYHGLYHLMRKYVEMFSKTVLFAPATWLLVSIFTIVLAIALPAVSQDKNVLLTLNFTAASYVLTELPFGPSAEFRYAYLSIIFAVFGLCVLAPRGVAALRASRIKLPSWRGLPTGPAREIEL